MNKECIGCKSMNVCNTAVQYGSIMCQINRMRAGQTKLEFLKAQEGATKYCPYCGRPIK